MHAPVPQHAGFRDSSLDAEGGGSNVAVKAEHSKHADQYCRGSLSLWRVLHDVLLPVLFPHPAGGTIVYTSITTAS